MAALPIRIITLFPDDCAAWASSSIVGRAQRRGIIDVECVDPRRWAEGRHKKVDDRPFGGGPGMVLMAPPMAGAIDHCQARTPGAILLTTSPQGRTIDQAWVRELSTAPGLIILCGHYEGIDQRIDELYRPQAFSLGKYVLSGGELPALVLVDAVTRLLPGALGDARSAIEDSFTDGDEVDHPSYTRPREFRGLPVPEALVSGNHAGVGNWRGGERQVRTRRKS